MSYMKKVDLVTNKTLNSALAESQYNSNIYDPIDSDSIVYQGKEISDYKNIIENELIVSASLNDLNSRLNESNDTLEELSDRINESGKFIIDVQSSDCEDWYSDPSVNEQIAEAYYNDNIKNVMFRFRQLESTEEASMQMVFYMNPVNIVTLEVIEGGMSFIAAGFQFLSFSTDTPTIMFYDCELMG